VHRHVGFERAVHAEHADPFRIGRGESAEPHQRRGDWEAGELDRKSIPLQSLLHISCIAMWVSSVLCIQSMPIHFGSAAGKAPSPISVEVIGKPVSLTNSRRRSQGTLAGVHMPPPV